MATNDITPIVETVLAQQAPEAFLVAVKQRPGKQDSFTVLADTDAGISLETCALINRHLRAALEETLGPQANFSLEVTSPGLNTPLTLIRQYRKNIGRELKVHTVEGPTHKGPLQAVTDTDITLEVKQKAPGQKKASPQPLTIPFDSIKTATVEVSFRAPAS